MHQRKLKFITDLIIFHFSIRGLFGMHSSDDSCTTHLNTLHSSGPTNFELAVQTK